MLKSLPLNDFRSKPHTVLKSRLYKKNPLEPCFGSSLIFIIPFLRGLFNSREKDLQVLTPTLSEMVVYQS